MTNQRHLARVVAFATVTLAFASGTAYAADVTPGQALQSVQPQRTMPINQAVQLPELVGNSVRPLNVPPGGATFRIDRFSFMGNTRIDESTLQSRVAQHKGKVFTLAELYAVAQDLTRYYQSQGYPLASVNVPVQKVQDGSILLEVTEGKIGQVRIEGTRYYQVEALRRQLSELPAGDVVTTARLERELLLLNDLPGIVARLVVMPGAEAGTSDLLIKVEEDVVSFYAGVDNYGREYLGETRFSFNLNLNGMGRGDVFSVNVTHSEDGLLDYYRVAYGMPIGTDGGRFNISYLDNQYRVGDPAFAILDPHGETYSVRGEYTYPLTRSRKENRVLAVGLVGNHTETEALGIITSRSEDLLLDVTLYTSRVLGDRRTVSWSLGFSGNGEFNKGNDEGEQCCKLFGDYSFTLPIASDWYSKTRFHAAYANDTVADTERFSLGGASELRGYQTSELRGDSGFSIGHELHRPFSLGGAQADAMIFGEFGQVTLNNGPNAGASSVISDLGVGLVAHDLYGMFDLNVILALPISGYVPSDGNDDGRAFISVSTRF